MENPASCEVILVLLGPLSLCRNTAGKWVTAQRSEQRSRRQPCRKAGGTGSTGRERGAVPRALVPPLCAPISGSVSAPLRYL